MFPRMLVATDFSECSDTALSAAVSLARATGATVRLLHVDEEESEFAFHSSDDLVAFLEQVERRRARCLDDLRAEIEEAGVRCSVARLKGLPSERILEAAEAWADLLVVGTSGAGGVAPPLMGSTAVNVLRHSGVPVLSVTAGFAVPDDGWSIRRVLYPTDFSDESEAGLERAATLCSALSADLDILHVLRIPTLLPAIPGEPPVTLPPHTVDHIQERFEEDLAAVAGSVEAQRVTYGVTIGASEAEEIVRHARDTGADVIVCPRTGAGAIRSILFGRTADGVAKASHVPVLTLAPHLRSGADET